MTSDITQPTNDAEYIDASHEQTTAPITPPLILPAPDLGKLGAEATIKYSAALADHIDGVRDEIKTIAEELCQELTTTAQNVREIGKLEAERIITSTSRMRAAVLDAKNLRNRFVNGDEKKEETAQ